VLPVPLLVVVVALIMMLMFIALLDPPEEDVGPVGLAGLGPEGQEVIPGRREFQKQLQQFRADMVRRAAAGLTAAAMEAIKTLLALLQSSNTGAVRLGAARAVLELGAKLRETVELEQRIAALEQKSERTGQT
jgi:hypothetical protein